jgi:predicted RNA-binding Zn-ribbon protein involved in translation (DUF1610 family)
MRLIDADELLVTNDLADKNKYGRGRHLNRDAMNTMMLYEFKGMVDDAPTADAKIIRHAYWETPTKTSAHMTRCSHCKNSVGVVSPNSNYLYCPWCGAKMDERTEEKK